MNALVKRKAGTQETLHCERSFSCTRQFIQDRDQFPSVLEETMVRIYILLGPKVSSTQETWLCESKLLSSSVLTQDGLVCVLFDVFPVRYLQIFLF